MKLATIVSFTGFVPLVLVVSACGSPTTQVPLASGATDPATTTPPSVSAELTAPATDPAAEEPRTDTTAQPESPSTTGPSRSPAEYTFETAAGDQIQLPQLEGFESPEGVKRHDGIPGLETQGIMFERREGDDGLYENYSIGLLAGPEVENALRDPRASGYEPVEGLFVGSEQVYTRRANVETAFPSYEFAWKISDTEAIAVLTEYIGEQRLLDVVYALAGC